MKGRKDNNPKPHMVLEEAASGCWRGALTLQL